MLSSIKNMKSLVNSFVVKACAIVLAVALCSHLLVTLHKSWPSERTKSRIIPRYVTQKEIRGPTYHVHHQIQDTEAPSENSILTPGGDFRTVRRKFQPRHALKDSRQLRQKSLSSDEGSRWRL